ncbi:MAG TPA: pyrroline-5-carboxylate reductase [Acidimicrobiales bacterium]|nr:pyrroline-5-carboxylate reductase [Acidimicrobiales bacterium]
MRKILVLGGGRMGSALLGGLFRSGWATWEECTVVEVRGETRELLADRFPGLRVVEVPEPAGAVVLAVKPQDVEAACRSLPVRGYERVLSIVAGATIAHLESWLWPGAAVIRAMPNTPALVGMSASAIAGGTATTEEDVSWAESVLSSIGVVVRLPERLLDSATGLSGSGPAYVFLVAEALVEAGVLQGLDREVSKVLANQTILGAARMLAESGESAEVLRAAVTSPGGTTAAGLRELEARAVRAAFLEAVDAAARRSRELGEPD